MSSKLKKKNKDKQKIERYIGINKQNTARFKQEKKEDDAILAISTSMCWMTYLSLLDVLGYKEKRLKKFYKLVSELKVRWAEKSITSQEMIDTCQSKGIDITDWLRSIPQSHKTNLCPIPITSKEGMKIVDSAVLANGLFTALTLKREFNATKKNILDVLEKMKFLMACYYIKQPLSKKPYLCDADILQVFRDELKLDLVTGNKVA